MEHAYSLQQAQPPWFVYQPANDSQPGHHGHFMPSPGEQPAYSHPMQYQHTVAHQQPFMPHTVQHYHQQPVQPKPGFYGSIAITPVASPQPQYQKPAMVIKQDASTLQPLNTHLYGPPALYSPSTPPLSTSGSTISSPPSSSILLPTPTADSGFTLLPHGSAKQELESGLSAENIANYDWTGSATSPVTPVYIQPSTRSTLPQQHDAPQLFSANSAKSSTSSLSSPPSPNSSINPRSTTNSASHDCCDPRYLTVGSGESVVSASGPSDFPPLPTLGLDDEEHRFTLAGAPQTPVSSQSSFSCNFEDTESVLPPFEHFLESDSEDDFISFATLTADDNSAHNQSKRQKVVSFSHEDQFLNTRFEEVEEDTLAAASFPSPPNSAAPLLVAAEAEMDLPKPKRKSIRKSKKAPSQTDSDLAESSYMASGNLSNVAGSHEQGGSSQPAVPSSTQSQTSSTDVHGVGSSAEAAAPTQTAAMNRRGRKQSLTEDPSKTFVCTLCSRRFRRQEHLKRHYRSLHTHDKPFECHDCGKTFSRSDNLAQHARTHGSGAIVMEVLEQGEIPPHLTYDGENHPALGAVLFEAAQAAGAHSTSSSGSESGHSLHSLPPSMSGRKVLKKRKRCESE